MKTARIPFSCSVLALSLAAAFPALAEDDVEALTTPESSVSISAVSTSRDNQRFGMYNGLSKDRDSLVGEVSLIKRDDTTGTWFRLEAKDIGLPTAEARVEHERQGDWSYYLEHNQMQRVTPYDVFTGIQGIGTTLQNAPNAGSVPVKTNETEFKLTRDKTSFGYSKLVFAGLEFKIDAKTERKTGNRLFGRGQSSDQQFLAEPVDTTTNQIDVTLSYVQDKLQLTGGYYGSFFNNRKSAIEANNPVPTGSLATLVYLPPENQAHQLHLNGGYDFSKQTRGTFKFAHTRNTQNDLFMDGIGSGNTSGATNLGGRVDTTLLQFGLTTRPVKDLMLTGNYRYEDRKDITAQAKYVAGAATTEGFNEPRSLTINNGKFEASYNLPKGFRLTGGIDYEQKQHSNAGLRVVGYRDKLEEISYRFDLRRSIAEDVNGTISWITSNRNGSQFKNLVNNVNAAYVGFGMLQPIFLADRDRNKLKALIDWSPSDALSMQFVSEDSWDKYGKRSDIGVRNGEASLRSMDASYTLSEKLKFTGWLTQAKSSIDQTQIAGAGTTNYANRWDSSLVNTNNTVGLGVRGKPTGKLELGADLTVSKDYSEYHLNGFGTSAPTNVPDVYYKQETIKLFAKYQLEKETALRLDYIEDRRRTDDWTWSTWTYNDGTWLYQNPDEKVRVLKVSVEYKFR
jgi:MtrB/PioB family decaheme-associated outer membrane protein